MRSIKLLGLALMAVFAFGVVVAATASAEEKEPAGLLYLSGEEGPVKVNGAVVAAQELKVTGLKNEVALVGTEVSFEGELGKGEGTHSTLGTLTVTFKGVKKGKIACSSENAAGTKDAKEVVLLQAANTDVHTVSLENAAGKLLPGLLVGLLEESKKDLTINCGGVKVLVLGATFLEVKGASATADVTEITVLPLEGAKCDKNDSLCTKELTSWAATATKKVGEKDEKVQCPLAAFVEVEEECATLVSAAAIPVKFSKMVLIDF
jgi:hypothetical protein